MIQLARKPVAIAFAETHIDEVLRAGARPPSMMMTHEQQRTPAPSLGKRSKPIRNHRRCSPFFFVPNLASCASPVRAQDMPRSWGVV